MLAPKCATYNDRLTFANPRYLKKAQSEKPCLHEIPYDTSDPANRFTPDREETMTLNNESRSKLNKDKSQNDSFRFEHELKTEMHEDFEYVKSLENEVDELESEKFSINRVWNMVDTAYPKSWIQRIEGFLEYGSRLISSRIFTFYNLNTVYWYSMSMETGVMMVWRCALCAVRGGSVCETMQRRGARRLLRQGSTVEGGEVEVLLGLGVWTLGNVRSMNVEGEVCMGVGGLLLELTLCGLGEWSSRECGCVEEEVWGDVGVQILLGEEEVWCGVGDDGGARG
ncbi:hypothetical protein Tco_1456887 [Tanacetum coccineum]